MSDRTATFFPSKPSISQLMPSSGRALSMKNTHDADLGQLVEELDARTEDGHSARPNAGGFKQLLLNRRRQRVVGMLGAAQMLIWKFDARVSGSFSKERSTAKWLRRGTDLALHAICRIEDVVQGEEDVPVLAGELAEGCTRQLCSALDSALCKWGLLDTEEPELSWLPGRGEGESGSTIEEAEPGFVDTAPTKEGMTRLLKAIALTGESTKLWD